MQRRSPTAPGSSHGSALTFLLDRLILLAILIALFAAVLRPERGPASVASKPAHSDEIPERAHFMVLLTYGSHVFGAFLKARPTRADLSELDDGEVYTISWLPKDGTTDAKNRPQPGRNYSLGETLARARSLGQTVTAYGPFRIDQVLFQKSLRQLDRLDSGAVRFSRDFGEERKLGRRFFGATAVADIETTFGLVELDGAAKTQGRLAAEKILRRWKPLLVKPSKLHDAAWPLVFSGLQTDGLVRRGFPEEPAKKSSKKSQKSRT